MTEPIFNSYLCVGYFTASWSTHIWSNDLYVRKSPGVLDWIIEFILLILSTTNNSYNCYDYWQRLPAKRIIVPPKMLFGFCLIFLNVSIASMVFLFVIVHSSHTTSLHCVSNLPIPLLLVMLHVRVSVELILSCHFNAKCAVRPSSKNCFQNQRNHKSLSCSPMSIKEKNTTGIIVDCIHQCVIDLRLLLTQPRNVVTNQIIHYRKVRNSVQAETHHEMTWLAKSCST